MNRLQDKHLWPQLKEIKEVTDEQHTVEDLRIRAWYGQPGEVVSKFYLINKKPETHYFRKKREGEHVHKSDIIAILKIIR